MKILVINGTNVRGITYTLKEMFLSHLRENNQIKEYYPKDLPSFCLGCKNCFLKGVELCPHAEIMVPLWKEIMESDVIVFAYPVYALRAPGTIKTLLDHFCVRWTVHRPEPEFFKKTAVIITNSIGAPNGSAQKDVITSLHWMGLSNIYCSSSPMNGDIFLPDLSSKHRKQMEKKMNRLANKVKRVKPRKHMNLITRSIFLIAKIEHKIILKHEKTPGLDTQHYIDHGWIKPKKNK